MDILTEAIAEELLDQHKATDAEREMVMEAVGKTNNPFDVPVLLAIFRNAER